MSPKHERVFMSSSCDDISLDILIFFLYYSILRYIISKGSAVPNWPVPKASDFAIAIDGGALPKL